MLHIATAGALLCCVAFNFMCTSQNAICRLTIITAAPVADLHTICIQLEEDELTIHHSTKLSVYVTFNSFSRFSTWTVNNLSTTRCDGFFDTDYTVPLYNKK